MTRSPVRGALLIASLFALACQEKAPKRAATALTRAAGDAAPPSVAVEPRFLELARAARDGAKAVAGSCTLHYAYPDYEGEHRFQDSCDVKSADLRALRAATDALGRAAPDAGGGAFFAEHVRLFTESVELERYRGILSHYQELARAWNAFQPGDPIAVDPITKLSGAYQETIQLAADGGTIVWTRCSEGPCIVVPYTERRR